jgi:hypothetical protein
MGRAIPSAFVRAKPSRQEVWTETDEMAGSTAEAGEVSALPFRALPPGPGVDQVYIASVHPVLAVEPMLHLAH